jgi:hypothetical protein
MVLYYIYLICLSVEGYEFLIMLKLVRLGEFLFLSLEPFSPATNFLSTKFWNHVTCYTIIKIKATIDILQHMCLCLSYNYECYVFLIFHKLYSPCEQLKLYQPCTNGLHFYIKRSFTKLHVWI